MMGYQYTVLPEAAGSASDLGDPSRNSEIGATDAGTSVSAGTVKPANRGAIVIANITTVTWVDITGTVAEVGDKVFHTFEGSGVTSQNNPANRRESAIVTAPGTIRLALSSTNPDNARSQWLIVK